MRGRAYAKVNLSLEVLGRRPDGYHELVSVFQTVSLFDELSLTPAEGVSLVCDVPDLAGDDNLVLRAARLLGRGGRFELRKGIPIAGGMGGGSSDAALALRLLAAVHRLGLSQAELLAAAAELGSDVPFFLIGGTALVWGRGERVLPLTDLTPRWLAVVNPGVPLSTPAVFRELRPAEYDDGEKTLRWAAKARALPPAINSLQAAAGRLEPRIATCTAALAAARAQPVLLSGSGPTVFGLCRDEAEAQAVAAKTGGWQARFVGRAESLSLAQD